MIEIRPVSGIPFTVRSVGIELRTVQKVSVPSKIGANKLGVNYASREYVLYSNPYAYRPPHNEFHQTLLGLDVPVMVPLPRAVISSGKFTNWDALTVHYLCVLVACGTSVDTEVTCVETFPVAIKVYDTLPLYRQFNEPVQESRTAASQQVVVDLVMPVSLVGPGDPFVLDVKVLANSQYNRVKKNLRMDRLTLQIKEVLEIHEGGLPPKRENKIFTKSVGYDSDLRLTTDGTSHQFRLDFPMENDYLQMYSRSSDDMDSDMRTNDPKEILQVNISRNKSMDELDEGIPPTHVQGFTTSGRLFSVRYDAVVKVKMSHTKDLEYRLPVTVLPFDRASSEYLLQWIIGECEIARNKFGKTLVNALVDSVRYEDMVAMLARFTPPPIVYRNTRADWSRLGYNPEMFGSTGGSLVGIID